MADTDSLLERLLVQTLDAAETALSAAGIDPPTSDGGEWYPGISHGGPVVRVGGAETLAVWLEGLGARPGGEGQRDSPGEGQESGWQYVAQVRVHYFACHPNVDDDECNVPAAEVRAAALRLARGAWAIACEVGQRRDDETLYEPFAGTVFTKRDVGIGRLLPQSVSGQSAGWQLNIEVGLPLVLDSPPPGS